MAITKVRLENFTVFDRLDLEPSPGINVLVGANGTGKTHLLKACYAACDVSMTGDPFAVKLVKSFLPSGPGEKKLERLINRNNESDTARIEIFRGDARIWGEFSLNPDSPAYSYRGGVGDWSRSPMESVYIPAKEVLSNEPDFLSLCDAGEIHVTAVYRDILLRAYRPASCQLDGRREKLLKGLEETIGGQVVIRKDGFFLRDGRGELEFTLLAEGLRKLGLLWLLIRNGALGSGAVLFWDEPEANLNPKLYGAAMQTLLELQRLGVQVFLATHDYVILRELDLEAKEGDKIVFHALYRPEATGAVVCQTFGSYVEVEPNPIAETNTSIYDRSVRRSLEGMLLLRFWWKAICRSVSKTR